MENRKLKPLSVVALIVSVLPLATLIPSFLKITLSDGVRSMWAGANIVFVVLGLVLSIICIRNNNSRSIVNVLSTAISVLWLLLMIGIVVLALFINSMQ